MPNPYDQFDQVAPAPIFTSSPDPTRPATIRKGNNEAAASDYDPAKNRNDVVQGNYQIGIQPTKDRRSLTDDMAKRYTADAAVRKYSEAASSYARALGTKQTPQGDLSLIYAYAKIMDPESVVREGEANSVSQSDTIAGRLVARLRKELGDGGTFSPEARKNLLSEMRNAVGVLNAEYIQSREMYGKMAEGYGLSAPEVIGPHKGLPFSKADAQFAGTTEPERDFYGNVIKPGQPIAPPARDPFQPGGNQGPDVRGYANDPTGNRTFLTERDRAFAEEANALLRRPGSTRQDFDAIASRYGAQPFGKDLDDALAGRAAGNNPAHILPTPTGFEEAGITGNLLGPWANSSGGAFAIGAGNAATFGQLGNLAELTGSSPGATDLAMGMTKENSLPYVVGELAGSIAPTLGLRAGFEGLSRFASNPTVASILASPVTADIAYGAATGAGQGNDPLYGAVEGALLGGAGSYIGGKVGSGLSRVRKPVGIEGLTPGESAVLSATNRTGFDPVVAALTKGDELGVPLTLADVSPEVNSLTGAAIRRSPTVSGQAQSTLIPRGRGQYDRFVGAVERDLGPVENIPQRSEDLIAKARSDAAPLYNAAYSAPGASVFDAGDLMGRPSMKKALGNAARLASEEGRDPTTLGFVFDEAGNPSITSSPSWQTLDYVKRGLDDVLESYRDKTTGKLVLDTEGRAVNSTLQDFLGRLDKMNPDYAAARAAYAGPAAERDALSRGQAAASMSPDQLEVNMSKATPSQADQMRLGFQSQLVENAGRLRYSGNPFEGTLGTPAMEQRLSALYPEAPSNVARLLAQSEMERQAAGSANRLIGNSMTAERQLADEAFSANPGVEAATDIVANALLGQVPITTAIRHGMGQRARDAVRLGLGRRAAEKAEQIGAITLNPSPRDTIAEILALQDQQLRYDAARAALGQTGGKVGGVIGVGAGTAALPYRGN